MYLLDSKNLEDLIYEKRVLVKGPKIVVIGGGTGLINYASRTKKIYN